MPRPGFPNPYCALPASCISRIRSEQDYYDQDPERAEREQRAKEERMREAEELEREQERYYFNQQRES